VPNQEGMYTEEEGKGMETNERELHQLEIKRLIERVFEGRNSGETTLSFEEYSQFNSEQSSEMFLTLMSVFHDKLPCA
jgi:tRNA splicing endonuclease